MKLPQWCWHTVLECVVEIKGAGHFPHTAMALNAQGQEIEIEIVDLDLNVQAQKF